MRILGIDPGTGVTGYGLVQLCGSTLKPVDYGCIRPPTKHLNSSRRRIIFDGVEELIETHSPDALSVETQFVYKNIKSAMTLGMVRGIIILAATRAGLPIFEYPPANAKRAVTGNGQASKLQVQAMVQSLLNLAKAPPEDAADALALAICHINAHRTGLQV